MCFICFLLLIIIIWSWAKLKSNYKIKVSNFCKVFSYTCKISVKTCGITSFRRIRKFLRPDSKLIEIHLQMKRKQNELSRFQRILTLIYLHNILLHIDMKTYIWHQHLIKEVYFFFSRSINLHRARERVRGWERGRGREREGNIHIIHKNLHIFEYLKIIIMKNLD